MATLYVKKKFGGKDKSQERKASRDWSVFSVRNKSESSSLGFLDKPKIYIP